MPQSVKRELAIGAPGKIADLVVPELVKSGVVVRALIHEGDRDDRARGFGASEIVVCDLSDRSKRAQSLSDVDGAFYIAPALLPKESDIGVGVVEAAKAAGVRRFVFSSVIHPILSSLANHGEKAPVEEAVLTSGMEYSFLHPTVFFQNSAGAWSRIVETGVLAEPWPADIRFSRVDFRDVAEAAAIAFTDDRLLYETFECCAPGSHDRRSVAAVIAEVLGRPINAETVDPKAAATAAGPGASGLERMFAWYDPQGLLGNSLTLASVLGRPPRTLRTYFEDLASGELSS